MEDKMKPELKSRLEVPLTEINISEPKYLIDNGTLKDAVEVMSNFNIGSIIVMNEKIELKGIFTERDVLKKVTGKDVDLDSPICLYMTPHPKTLKKENTVLEAIELMHTKNFRHIPIVDDEKRPIGIISIKDVMNFIYEKAIG